MIKDDDLYYMLTYGDSNEPTEIPPFGNWSSSPSKGCAAILTFLFSRGHKLERLPWFADRRLTEIPHELDGKRLSTMLTPGKIAAMSCDLDGLYQNTQKWLATENITSMPLCRSVYDRHEYEDGAATLLARLNAAAKQLRQKSFVVEMDTLSSWGTGGYWRDSFKRIVDLKLNVPAENVAWLWHRIGQRSREKSHMNTSESGEWVVINRSMKGHVEIMTDNVIERTETGRAATQKWLAQCRNNKEELELFLEKGSAFPRPLINTRQGVFVKKPWPQLSWKERIKRSYYLLSARDNVEP